MMLPRAYVGKLYFTTGNSSPGFGSAYRLRLPPDRRRIDGRAGDCRTPRFLGTARRDRSAAGTGRPLKSLVATEATKKLASPQWPQSVAENTSV